MVTPVHACPACDTPLPEAASFCPGCGAATPTTISGDPDGVRTQPGAEVDQTAYEARLQRAISPGYELRGLIGGGGFASVYVAFDVQLKREVAIKVLRSDIVQTQALSQRFRREAEAVAKLNHPHIISIYTVGEADGLVYFIMPRIRGASLGSTLDREGRLSIDEARRIMRDAAAGLHAAHRAGVVHRDIKPDNIMLDGEERRVLLVDFGIAKALDAEREGLTRTGSIIGTPQYMSPEQASGEAKIDYRADIYSLGMVAYHMVGGCLPFEGKSAQEFLIHHIMTAPRDLLSVRPDVPVGFAQCIMRCLEKEPQARWSSAAEVVEALEQAPAVAAETAAGLGVERTFAQEIASALETRRCLLFLGLHLPAGDGTPEPTTIDRLISEFLAGGLDGEDASQSLARIAQDLEMARGRIELLRRLRAAIQERGASPEAIIQQVVGLPFSVIVTTSYDTRLEAELERAGRSVHRVSQPRDVPDDMGGGVFVHLFGDLEHEESVVITEDDLWEFFSGFQSVADPLKSLFATRTILFLGYSPEDEAFRHLYSQISRLRAARKGGCYLAATGVPEPQARWAEGKGLQIIDQAPEELLAAVGKEIEAWRGQGRARDEYLGVPPIPSRPYKFLNYYETSDESIFFGRESETRKLLSKIHAYTLNLLYAPSGSGKTSLIHAGLIPALLREGYCTVYARVYDDPEGEIRQAALNAAGVFAGDFAADTPLAELLPQLAARIDQPIVVFVDQLEEIFIRFDHEVRDRFAATLQSCVAASSGKVRFILSLREDFLARLSEFRERIPTIFHNEFRLDPLSEEASRAAIAEPAKLVGLEVESELVDRLIADLFLEGIEPPQLQIVCDSLYDALDDGETRITLKSYERLGETRKILANYLERVLRELSAPERGVARELLKNLVTSEDTKTVTPITDLVRAVGRDEEEVSRILGELANRRLIRRVQREEGFWYELTHEYLVEEIGRWLSDKEKELKKVRELLEQAVRNYRHLGILMPPAQMRIIRAHENDLNLTKEERQLLRASEASRRAKRRTAAVLAAAAVLLLAVGGVAWRYVYLNSHIFLESEDRELVETSYGRQDTHRFEVVSVYAGSPARSWLDRLLGFPERLNETDINLDQIDPAHRDLVKSGLTFGKEVNIEEEIYQMLRPSEQVRFLVLRGRSEEALALMPGLYSDKSVDAGTLDSLGTFLGVARVQDEPFLRLALAHAFRPGGLEFWYPGAGLSNKNIPLVAILRGTDPAAVADYLLPYLEARRSLTDALAVLGLLGEAGDVQLVAPHADDYDPDVRTAAVAGLIALGGCSELPRARGLMRDAEVRGWYKDRAFNLIAVCGSPGDVAVLEQAASQALDDEWTLRQLVAAMYSLGGRSALPAMRRVVALRPSSGTVLYGLGDGLDPAVISYLHSKLVATEAPVRARAASLLAMHGDPGGLGPGAAIGIDDTEDEGTREVALEAFSGFRGPPLKRFLLQLLVRQRPEAARVRAEVYRALRWYDDQEALRALVGALQDEDRYVRETVVTALRRQRSDYTVRFLRDTLPALGPTSRVYAARALQQLERAPHIDVFKNFLEAAADSIDDYAAIGEAVRGLRHAYLYLPVAEAADALRDPRHVIRLAGTLALIEHSDRARGLELVRQLAEGDDPASRTTALQVLSALRVAERTEETVDRARAAYESGDVLGASRILEPVYFWPLRFSVVVGAGLSPWFREWTDPMIDKRGVLAAQLSLLHGGSATAAIWTLERMIREDPDLLETVLNDPAFDRLRETYYFQVHLGLTEPILVEKVELPELPAGILDQKTTE